MSIPIRYDAYEQVTPRVFKVFSVVTISLVILFVYRDLFGLWFTDVDTFPLIFTGRIDSLAAAVDVFSSPLMQGLMPNALFYRPLASIIWGIESYLWGLNPLGYHLMDLALHIANSILLFFILRVVSERFSSVEAKKNPRVVPGDFAALTAALVFAAHPIAMETVPAIARRPDLLLGFFLLLMLGQLGKTLSKQKSRCSGLAILFCLLGLASKDSAVVLPGIAIAYVFCFSAATTFSNRVKHCLRSCWPLVITAVMFMGIRTLVLDGLGGYAGADSFAQSANASVYPYLCAFFFSGDLDVCIKISRPRLSAAAVVILVSLALASWRVRMANREVWPDPAVRWIAFAVLSLGALFTLHVAAGTAASLRTMYTALLFFSIIIGWGVVIVPQALLARGKLRDCGFSERAVHAVAAIFLVVALSGVLRGAWSGQYISEWKSSTEVAKRTFTDFAKAVEPVAKDSIIYLVDFPFRVGSRLPFRERPIIIEHTVQGFVDLVFPEKQLDVVGLSYLTIEQIDPVSFESEVQFLTDPARLDIHTGPGAFAQRRPWFNRYAKRSPWRSNTYSRNEAERLFSIELNPEVDLEGRAEFIIYLGDRVERRGVTPWVVSH